MITSECPGWICYVEKVVKEPIISLCSRIKTPQMLAGELLKNLFVESGFEMANIVIASINPCHDKKLETFRIETMLPNEMKSLDVVLSTTELLEMIESNHDEFHRPDISQAASNSKVCWQVDQLFEARLKLNAPIPQAELSNYKLFAPQNHPLYSSSTGHATSNNYLNQTFIKAVLDKTG